MADDRGRGVSRRDVLTTGAGVGGTALLAGCTSSLSGSDGDEGGPTDSPTATDTSYSVSMELVGEVEFDEVPETWVPFTGDWADMGVALWQADGLAGVGIKAR